jgi:transposase
MVMAQFPEDVRAPVQYGVVIKAWAVYYQHQHFIPEDRLQQLFNDLYNVRLATATLTRCSQVAFDALAPFEEAVLSIVKLAAVKNLDETGFRVAGKTQWLHVASTQTATYYHVSPKRKSLLDGLCGTVVHDHWKAYYNLPGVLRVFSARLRRKIFLIFGLYGLTGVFGNFAKLRSVVSPSTNLLCSVI